MSSLNQCETQGDAVVFQPKSPRYLLLILLLIAGMVYFWNLGAGSLREWDEALSAERSREMVETGKWLTPQFGYEADFNKPPLYYWLTAINLKIFGIHEFSVRLWSALFGLACIGLVYLIGRDIGRSAWAGLIAAFILAFNPHWINMTREGLLDSGMLFGMLSAILLMNMAISYGAKYGENKPSLYAVKLRGLYAVSGVCLAIGILIKGPLPFFVFVVPLWDRFVSKVRRHSLLNLAVTFAVSIGVATPWFLYQYFDYGDAFYRRYISRNLFDRFTQTIESHHGSIFFYIGHWYELATVSLFLFIVALFVGAVVDRRLSRTASSMFMLALLFLVFLSIASSKRDLYLLLIYPFAATGCGVIFANSLQSAKAPWMRKYLVPALVVISILSFFSFYDGFPDHGRWLKQTGLKIAEVAPGNETVWSVNIPVNNFLFYAQRPVRYLPMERLQEKPEILDETKGDRFIFIVHNKELAEFRSKVEAVLGNSAGPGEAVFQNRKHTILSFRKK